MAQATPFYHLVPKDRKANLKFRAKLLAEAKDNPSVQSDLFAMCARDPLFYTNTFVWTIDPREDFPALPMITYKSFQDEGILTILDALGKHDVGIEKSRDMGASWICLCAFLWRWHFRPLQLFLLLSRNENYVDKADNPKAMFQRLDFVLKNMPYWLKPNINRIKLHLGNTDNDSSIDGESTTGEAARGDRRTGILLDEFGAFEIADGFRALAATQYATPCRIFNSTPAGVGNAHEKQISLIKSTGKGKILRFHWSQHPKQRRGLYKSTDGKLEILDKDYKFPEGYPFILDGKLRSIYYDDQWLRCPIPSVIASELDIDYVGSGSQFFDTEVLERLLKATTSAAIRGRVDYTADGTNKGFKRESRGGNLWLWVLPDKDGLLPQDREYAVGCDISNGTGATNSVASIVDRLSGKKVGELVTRTMRPEEFARQVVALCQWLHSGQGGEESTYLLWEANGPGRPFGSQVRDLGYSNVYYKTDDTKVNAKPSAFAGWFSTGGAKKTLFTDYQVALAKGLFTNPSRDALLECSQIIYMADGSIGHAASVTNMQDPASAGENHGDRVVADALACKGVKERPFEVEEEDEAVPDFSFAARRADRKAQTELEESSGWRVR